MGAIDLELYTKLLRSTPTGAASDSAGSLAEQLAYLVANPSSPSFAKLPTKLGVAGGDTFAGITQPMIGFVVGHHQTSGVSWTTDVSNPTTASIGVVFDTDVMRNYWRSVNGTRCYMQFAATSRRLFPSGALGSWPDFDMNGDTVGLLPNQSYDTLVVEFEAAFPTATARTTDLGIGISSQAFSSAFPFQSSVSSIGVIRTASGWGLQTSDALNDSSSNEAADTSDGNRHIFRIEWENIAGTSTARLYVDGTLKITKTTNMPDVAPSSAGVMPQYFGACVPSSYATDHIRLYAMLAYWKVTA